MHPPSPKFSGVNKKEVHFSLTHQAQCEKSRDARRFHVTGTEGFFSFEPIHPLGCCPGLHIHRWLTHHRMCWTRILTSKRESVSFEETTWNFDSAYILSGRIFSFHYIEQQRRLPSVPAKPWDLYLLNEEGKDERDNLWCLLQLITNSLSPKTVLAKQNTLFSGVMTSSPTVSLLS